MRCLGKLEGNSLNNQMAGKNLGLKIVFFNNFNKKDWLIGVWVSRKRVNLSSTTAALCIISGKSQPVWPDLTKFRHFVTTLKYFGHFESVHFFCKNFEFLRQIRYAIGQIFFGGSSQILNK